MLMLTHFICSPNLSVLFSKKKPLLPMPNKHPIWELVFLSLFHVTLIIQIQVIPAALQIYYSMAFILFFVLILALPIGIPPSMKSEDFLMFYLVRTRLSLRNSSI